MSWTDSDTVKKHLPGLTGGATQMREIPVTFSEAGTGRLPHPGIVSSSESIKLVVAGLAGPSAVTLPAETWVALPHSQLRPGEAIVASGWQLTTVYEENRDYLLDAAQGKVRRIAGGAISDGATVQVWYQRYQKMVKGADYTINYGSGELTIPVGSGIEPGATVVADYDLTAASSVEDLIPAAITEAEDKILRRLKSEYTASSTDQGLKTGATELAAATLCRALAGRALSDGAPAASQRAKYWLEAARQLQESALGTLRSFLAAPLMKAAGRQGNANWEWV